MGPTGKRYCPTCDRTWPSWWLKTCPECDGELIEPETAPSPPAEEDREPAPPDPWGNWALGLGLACIVIAPVVATAWVATLAVSAVALYKATRGESTLWKGATGAILGFLFALVWLEIWLL